MAASADQGHLEEVRRLRGTDLFNRARQTGKWVNVHKSDWL